MYLIPEGRRLDRARHGVKQTIESIHAKEKYGLWVRARPVTGRESSARSIDESVCFGEECILRSFGDVVAFHVWRPGE